MTNQKDRHGLALRACALILALGITLGLFAPQGRTAFAQDEFPENEPTAALTDEPTPPATDELPPDPDEDPVNEPTIEPTIIPVPEETPTDVPTPEISPEPDLLLEWELKFDSIPVENLQAAKQIVAQLNTLEYSGEIRSPEGDSFVLIFKGNDSLSEIRDLLFDKIKYQLNFLGGAAEVFIEMPVIEPTVINLDLESNITTGYGWEIAAAEIEGSDISGSSQYLDRPGIGAPGVQSFSFNANRSGTSRIHLIYRMPFIPDEKISRHLEIKLFQPKDNINISNPDPQPPSQVYEEVDKGISTIDDIPLAEPLPSSFDWRSRSAVSSVKMQGGCGSCWAFATVGVMESALMRAGYPEIDLSEQFLISCNKDGWNCEDGGGTAHKYHYDTKGKNQTAIGAVLETAKPYTASNGTCSSAYDHPYKLNGWKYVGLSGWITPTVEQIKKAIYVNGPVSTFICAGEAFLNYRGGIFSTNETECDGKVNHVVVLVGWNDADGGYWILKNSHSSAWGESGYMRIKYGTSRVGLGTAWVKFTPPVPKAPALVSPAAGSFTKDTTPDLTWGSTAYAQSYHLQVSSSYTFGTIVQQYENLTSLTRTLSTISRDGKYYWRVRAKNISGVYGPWSAKRAFTLDTIPPNPPTHISPVFGAVTTGTPVFKWSTSSGAKTYSFAYSTSPSSPDAYPQYVVFRTSGLTTTSFKPPVMAAHVQYYWFIRAVDAAGNESGWTAPFSVKVKPPIPAKVSLTYPSSGYTTSSSTIVLAWQRVDYGYQYQIQLDDNYNFSSPNYTYDSQVGAASYQLTNLVPGKWYWRVRAKNVDNQFGPWSASRNFQYSIPTARIAIRLTWGDTVPDLDSHLWLPSATPFHVYYMNKGYLTSFPFAQLDGDDTTYLGPEVITVTELKPGIYQYNVHRFTPSTSDPTLKNSGAKVEVFRNGSLIKTLNVSGAGGISTGRWWKVFTYNSSTNTFSWVNTLSDTPDSAYSTALSEMGEKEAPADPEWEKR